MWGNVGPNTARETDQPTETVLMWAAEEYVVMYQEQAVESRRQLEALQRLVERHTILRERLLARFGMDG